MEGGGTEGGGAFFGVERNEKMHEFEGLCTVACRLGACGCIPVLHCKGASTGRHATVQWTGIALQRPQRGQPKAGAFARFVYTMLTCSEAALHIHGPSNPDRRHPLHRRRRRR